MKRKSYFGLFSFLCILWTIIFMVGCPSPVITPPDPPDPPDPIIEYVERSVCLESGLLEHIYCPPETVTRKKFVEGTEPTTWCDFHKKPPDPPFVYPEVIEDIHAGFLGIYLWYLVEGWNPADDLIATEELAKTLHEVRIRQIGTIDFFLWASDGKPEHKHFNRKTPYLPLTGYKFDLSKWQDRYFELFEKFVIECKKIGLRPAPHLFMDRYDYGPFENNINGVRRFWTDVAFPYQAAFAEKICQILDKYFDNYWIKPINEAAHRGGQDMFHRIGDWHRDIWEDVLSKHMRIKYLILDSSMSEGVFMHLIDVTDCPKPYYEGEEHGNEKYDRKYPNKSILPEAHSVSTKESLLDDDTMMGIENSRWRRLKFHGDGSYLGNWQLGNTSFRQGDVAEVYEMAFYLYGRAKHKNKQAIYAIFPMESFDMSGIGWKENYTVDHIFWDRLDALVRAWKDVYK